MDVKREWVDSEARRVAAHVDRSAARLEALAERYVTLRGHLPAGGRRGGGDEPAFHAPAGPRAPLRVDVVDVRQEVALFVRDFLPRVRLALRLPGILRGAGDVVPGLLSMARFLPGVFAADRPLGDEISRGAWDLERRAAWAAGEVPRPFALTEECGGCGLRSLWVVPARMVIRCGNPACSREEPVGPVAVPVTDA
ncbi:hypothetical protein PBI_ANDREW_50 [Arthrobacter phage Andrew]|uniref:Uncharacterized protein n=1 Tax=Arthrobacter phage Andrew TaxID=2419946 RepID=A0A3G2KCX1_9CAUD|nr:hypothetical protein HOU53_gp50 [Arthrobacter phage Andrew]AYN56864.1 hypothetical protein PBI_ANDREW_50 [Arthrobacter phage Andrew]